MYFASWDYYTSVYAPSLPHVGRCQGEPYAAVSGCLILSSYLVLFISFYIATYKKASKRAAHKKIDKLSETPAIASMKESAAIIADGCSSGAQHRPNRLMARK